MTSLRAELRVRGHLLEQPPPFLPRRGRSVATSRARFRLCSMSPASCSRSLIHGLRTPMPRQGKADILIDHVHHRCFQLVDVDVLGVDPAQRRRRGDVGGMPGSLIGTNSGCVPMPNYYVLSVNIRSPNCVSTKAARLSVALIAARNPLCDLCSSCLHSTREAPK
jgi:hypothetical protein